jgi:polyisoprenoid-binding protein YceI
MNRYARLLVLALASVAPASALLSPTDVRADAPSSTWSIDENHTAVSFSIRHLGVSNVPGSFGKVSGTVVYDGKDVSSLRVDVSVDAASVDTRNAKRDEHLRSADFFDVAAFPRITFKSKRAVPGAPGHFKVVGDLTLHGVTKEVTLDLEGPSAEAKDPYGKTHVGAHASLTIDRKAFGIGSNVPSLVVGDEVRLSLDIELLK